MDKESDTEALRWAVARYTFASPEEWEASRGTPWLAEGRNHTTWKDDVPRHGCPSHGIQREERDDGDRLGIGNEDAETFARLVVGRRITAVHREPDDGDEWTDGQNSVTITLDDGATLHFMGWGYDASGLDTSYGPP